MSWTPLEIHFKQLRWTRHALLHRCISWCKQSQVDRIISYWDSRKNGLRNNGDNGEQVTDSLRRFRSPHGQVAVDEIPDVSGDRGCGGVTTFNGKRKYWVRCVVEEITSFISYETDGLQQRWKRRQNGSRVWGGGGKAKEWSLNDAEAAATEHSKVAAEDNLTASTAGRIYMNTKARVKAPIEPPNEAEMMTHYMLAVRGGVSKNVSNYLSTPRWPSLFWSLYQLLAVFCQCCFFMVVSFL